MKNNQMFLPVDSWTKSGTGLTEMILCAPTQRALMDAREHLRYWPYVKSFDNAGYRRLRVVVFIGRGYSRRMWQEYCQSAVELMSLCVRQHGAYFKNWSAELSHFEPQYTDSEYLRPDNLLQPMSNFIDEINL